MADEFKNYDKFPILDAIKSRWLRFTLKDMIFPAVIVVLVLICVLFAGLFGKTKNDLTEVTSASSSALLGGGLCTEVGCMETAARAMEYRNTSVDPCEDFFEYACGNYLEARTFKLNNVYYNVLGDMYQENKDKLIDLMERPISQMHDYAAERKVKQFFQACNDMFSRDKKKGLPILNKVLPELGGWKVLGTWQNNTWDFNTVLKKVQTDFWVDALYRVSVETDWYDTQKRAILLAPGGLGNWMYWTWYVNPRFEKNRQDYKKFIRRVGSLLARDAVEMKVVPSSIESLDTLLDEFVNDSFAIESKMAQIIADSDYTEDRYAEANKPTLAQLTTDTNNVIDWTQQLAYMFSYVRISGSTKVVLTHTDYFQNISNMISSLAAADKNRMLHNYLIWRVVENYISELSWDYIHANREVFVDLYKRESFLGLFRYCFAVTTRYMGDALGSLYINHYFSKESRETVHDITDNIRQALKEQLEKTPWMDGPTKQYARERLDKVILKMGYPDWMDNVGNVDQMYNGLSVNLTDHFTNMLSGNQFHRNLMNEDLNKASGDREEWTIPIYSTTMYVYLDMNEISAPAGILQFPVYSKKQPHSATFGSFGSVLARFFHHVIDEWGRKFDKGGNYMGRDQTWWSNKSVESYEPVRKCVENVYNVTKTYRLPDGTTKDVRLRAKNFVPFAISWTNGVRLALIGYRDWMKNLGIAEKLVPGLGLTNEQTLFLAHAQTFCYDKTSSWYVNSIISGWPTNDVKINMALGQLPEFSEAFKCKKGSQMYHEERCDYY
ncbi:endothelin-converting enzyme-like 1 [Biomphalaria glabrata]|uniref:Endothelin-converting enzyme-like 1 n=1 Tax=Biomphalaria glabrata TaxID=6526 RepID=A0A9W3B923_BIOGL|nr:endothelin-converting enzyme-like 1 [Biomphalaria glabrata]XP_055896047.1 endothelin-converting enzyme-like 1 [Biomphalaria glabrata]